MGIRDVIVPGASAGGAKAPARLCGGRVVGAAPTGLLDDRTAGPIAVKRCGGASVAQDP